jgi:hypothetical protein
MSDLELQTLLGFNEEDLIANRDCRLSARQQEQLNRSEWLWKRLFVGTGIVLVLIAAGNAYGVISSVAKQGFLFSAPWQSDFASFVIRLGIPMLLFGFLAWGAFTFSAYKMDHSVQLVRGRVHFIKVEKAFSEKRPNGSIFYRTLEVYELHVGKVNFENINQRIMDVIEAGDIYAFYYIKDTKNILSAERIAKGK